MTNRLTIVSFACVTAFALSSLLSLTSSSAIADSPSAVVRTFGFKMPLHPDIPVTDFLDDASVAVVVAPPDTSTSQSYLDFRPDLDADDLLDGTTWAYRPTMHIAAGPDDASGAFLWLVTEDNPEPPPIGSRTLTGPNSPLILEQSFYFVRLRSSAPNVGDYEQTDPETADDVFVVVTAVFSR